MRSLAAVCGLSPPYAVPHRPMRSLTAVCGPSPPWVVSQRRVWPPQVLDALQFLHHRGIVHLNLQPDNVLMTSRRRLDVKLVDFGRARKVTSVEGERVGREGTAEYMGECAGKGGAPWLASRTLDPRVVHSNPVQSVTCACVPWQNTLPLIASVFSDRTLEIVGPFYPVSMPGEVKYPTRVI